MWYNKWNIDYKKNIQTPNYQYFTELNLLIRYCFCTVGHYVSLNFLTFDIWIILKFSRVAGQKSPGFKKNIFQSHLRKYKVTQIHMTKQPTLLLSLLHTCPLFSLQPFLFTNLILKCINKSSHKLPAAFHGYSVT